MDNQMPNQHRINWAAWIGVMATIITLCFRGVWTLSEIAHDVAAQRDDIRAIRGDMKGFVERLEGIEKWRARVDERLKVSGLGE
jgi:hypothetical protein